MIIFTLTTDDAKLAICRPKERVAARMATVELHGVDYYIDVYFFHNR